MQFEDVLAVVVVVVVEVGVVWGAGVVAVEAEEVTDELVVGAVELVAVVSVGVLAVWVLESWLVLAVVVCVAGVELRCVLWRWRLCLWWRLWR